MIEGGAGRCSNQDQPAKSEDDLRRDVDGIGPWADKNGEKDSADQHSAPHDVFGAVSPHNFSRNQGVSGVGKGTDQTEKQGVPGDCKVPRPSAGADDKGARHRGDDCGCFRLFRKRSGADAGDDQNDDRGQILQHRRGSGVGIIDRHKKGKLCQADTENREKDQCHRIFPGLPDGRMRRCFGIFFTKNQVQQNQDNPGADLPDTEDNRCRECQIVQQILPGTSGKSPTESCYDNGNGAE